MTMMFKPATATNAYLKMAFIGFAGSGKTFTATSTAIGLVLMMRQLRLAEADRPVLFLDTEKGSDWVIPRFKAAGVELHTFKTRAFADLVPAVGEAVASGSLLLIDSLTHFWREFCESYMRAKKRTRLQFDDWAYLKAEWGKFTEAFINSPRHIILCGRAGYEYDMTVDEETQKKNLEKTGIKMKAEGEMGYEPDLLVLMDRITDMATKQDRRIAHVMKDRSTLLDGLEFADPTFESFLPHIKCLNLGGTQLGVDVSRNSETMIPRDVRSDKRVQREVVLDEIQSLLGSSFPGSANADKKAKLDLLYKHFAAFWAEIEKVVSLDKLRAGYDSLHQELKGSPSRYHKPALIDEIGDVPDFLDRRIKPPVAPLPNGRGAVATDPGWTEQFLG